MCLLQQSWLYQSYATYAALCRPSNPASHQKNIYTESTSSRASILQNCLLYKTFLRRRLSTRIGTHVQAPRAHTSQEETSAFCYDFKVLRVRGCLCLHCGQERCCWYDIFTSREAALGRKKNKTRTIKPNQYKAEQSTQKSGHFQVESYLDNFLMMEFKSDVGGNSYEGRFLQSLPAEMIKKDDNYLFHKRSEQNRDEQEQKVQCSMARGRGAGRHENWKEMQWVGHTHYRQTPEKSPTPQNTERPRTKVLGSIRHCRAPLNGKAGESKEIAAKKWPFFTIRGARADMKRTH